MSPCDAKQVTIENAYGARIIYAVANSGGRKFEMANKWKYNGNNMEIDMESEWRYYGNFGLVLMGNTHGNYQEKCGFPGFFYPHANKLLFM